MRHEQYSAPELFGSASLLLRVTEIDDTDSPYTVIDAEDVILADATAGAITINLPPLSNSLGRAMWMKNIGSGANAVTLDGDGADQIEGSLTYVLSAADEGVMIIGAAASWFVVLTSSAATTAVKFPDIMSAVSLRF